MVSITEIARSRVNQTNTKPSSKAEINTIPEHLVTLYDRRNVQQIEGNRTKYNKTASQDL